MEKEALSLAAILIAFVGFYFYLRDIYLGRTKPHAITWFIWSLFSGIGFLGQISGDAGPGAWPAGVTSALCLLIFILSMFRGEKTVTRGDWICLGVGCAAVTLWAVTNTPVWSILLVTFGDYTAYVPTWRKTVRNPYEETLFSYLTALLKHILTLLALDRYVFVTAFYPSALVLANGAFLVMMVVRRRQVPRYQNTGMVTKGYS